MRFVESCNLPTEWGDFRLHAFEDAANDKSHLALTYGRWEPTDSLLLRLHSECLTGDALFSKRCDCGAQLNLALRRIVEEGRGLVLYLRQEGRGIGLLNKVRAYHLQDRGSDTVEANEQLGFEADERDYSMCGPMLRHLGVRRVRLLTNNPHKVAALNALGLVVEQRIAHQAGANPHNERYLQTKAGKLGHMLG
ncbi:MAG: GTP cyclohydrolase II [Cellvibrionales bacterium]|nr:GTP cyclohydrolase II [Cellvibrionales bacterium]